MSVFDSGHAGNVFCKRREGLNAEDPFERSKHFIEAFPVDHPSRFPSDVLCLLEDRKASLGVKLR